MRHLSKMTARAVFGADWGWMPKAVEVEEVVRDIMALQAVQAVSSSPYQAQIDHYENTRNHLVSLYQHVFDGVLDGFGRSAALALRKHKVQDDAGVAALFLILTDDFDSAFAAALRQAGKVAYSYSEHAMATNEWGELTARSEEFAKQRAEDLEGVPEEVLEKARASVQEGLKAKASPTQLVRRLNEALDAAKGTVGSRLAETEATITLGTAVDATMQAAGFTHKRWLSVRDDRVRHSHEECDKQGWIPLGKTFVNGLKYPGQADAPMEEIANCRCVLIGEKR